MLFSMAMMCICGAGIARLDTQVTRSGALPVFVIVSAGRFCGRYGPGW